MAFHWNLLNSETKGKTKNNWNPLKDQHKSKKNWKTQRQTRTLFQLLSELNYKLHYLIEKYINDCQVVSL